MKKNNIAIIGECMVELQQAGELYKPSFGGDTLNTALYLARLTAPHGIETAYFTGLGRDPFSKAMLTSWQSEAINTQHVRISETKLPGMYAIETAEDGERSFYYWRNDSAAKYWLRGCDAHSLSDELSEFKWIYLSGISLAILPTDCLETLYEALVLCRDNGVHIAFDNNYRPALWDSTAKAREIYQKFMALTDLAFLTFDDEMMLWGDTQEDQAITRAQQCGIQEVIIKRGSQPCLIIDAKQRTSVAANQIDHVVDTTAAGDSFSAGYLAKRITGGSPQAAAQLGHQLAGNVIQHRGAVIAREFMPNM
ncbi:sugar kinase [Vibrio palustris]|uniref:2-dehydro-3-deoxygluconokinase n=1 Tax=Vibrio palustris TaxID=1918946 RepID=A0A1R4B5R5_9VIBR|nr:sugar kinase [Vibrio palustris]SJL84272.1 2-dehydro-3-deoxygluconokinase [Vibrio palustris]